MIWPSQELTATTPPAETTASFQYQTLPQQLVFHFSNNVTSGSWLSALTVVDLNTGNPAVVHSATYNASSDSVTYAFRTSAVLPNGNYAAILDGSQITDASSGLELAGNDGVAGHAESFNFYFLQGETTLDGTRSIGVSDFNDVTLHYGSSPATYSEGDVLYDGTVDSNDYSYVSAHVGNTLPLLGTPGTPTAAATGNTRFEIAWNAPTDPNVTEFDVYRDSTRIASNVTATSYLDTGLTPGTTHGYLIVGRDAGGDSSFPSPELVASTPAITSLTVQPPATGVISAGQTYGLSTTFADIGALTTHSAVINWGDGTTGTATLVESGNTGTLSGSHEYDGFGAFFGTVAVTDPNGSTAVEIFEVVVPTYYNYDSGSGFTVAAPYTLTPTFSDPDGSTPASYTVAWGDGSSTQTYSGSTDDFTHTFSSAGGSPYDATVLAMAADGTFTDYPYIAEVAPTLTVSGGSGATEGAAVVITSTVSGSSSGDTYEWTIDWGDGSTPTDVTAGPGAFSHTYSDAGTYSVDAYLADNSSSEAADQELTIGVAIAQATASFTSTGNATEGVAANFTDTFTDPGGATLDNLSIAWGDGKTDGYYLNPGNASHVYDLPGTYTGTAIFSYDDGTYDAAFTRAVADASVSVSLYGAPINRGDTYFLNTTFTDAAGDTPTQYVIAWGDGASSTYGTSTDYQGIFPHHYDPATAPSTPTVQVTVTVPDGTYGASTTAEISDPDPYFSFYYAARAEGGASFYIYGTEGPTAADYAFTYSINWGDGFSSSETGPDLSHKYTYNPAPNANNAYEFTITASTNTGWERSYTNSIAVDDGGNEGISLSGNTSTPTGDSYSLDVSVSGVSLSFDGPVGAVYWGDGSSDYFGFVNGYRNGYDEGLTHLYEIPGTYEIETDVYYVTNNVDYRDYGRTSVTVQDPTPTVTVSGPQAAVVGEGYELTYPSQDIGAVASWTISWGDGNSAVYRSLEPTLEHDYATASAGGETYDINVTAVMNDGQSATASTSVLVAQPQMHVINPDGSTMNHNDQVSYGMFLSVDSGDDTGATDSSGNPIENLSQTSMSVADSDLVEVTFDSLPSAVGGTYSLAWGGSDFTVWADPYKDRKLLSGTTFAATGSIAPVYLEGVSLNALMGADHIELAWGNAYGMVAESDVVPVSNVSLAGPLFVPEYGTYEYNVTGSFPDFAVPEWTVSYGSDIGTDLNNPNAEDVAWNSPNGSATTGWYGTLSCTINDIPVRLPAIHVFAIDVSNGTFNTDASAPIDGTNVHINPTGSAANNSVIPWSKSVKSGSNDTTSPGLSWGAQVSVVGPVKAGHSDNSGANLITVGFIQNTRLGGVTLKGTYHEAKNGSPGGTLESTADAIFATHVFLDNNFPQYVGSKGPWFITNNSGNSTFTPSVSGGVYTGAKNIVERDTPKLAIPLDKQLDKNRSNLNGRGNNLLSNVNILFQFQLNICAQTAQATNKANKTYVREAYVNWQFNGDGTVDLNKPPNYPYTGTGSGVTIPAGKTWVAVADGSEPVTDTSKVALNVLTTENWS